MPLIGSRRQCGEKHLRFRGLGKFRRRRKAFECRSENGVRVGGTVRALIKPRERQRGAQLETFRLLLLRDGNSSEKRLLRRPHVRWGALEKNLAADAMQPRV